MVELTDKQKIRLAIYKLVGADKAAAEKAIDFVNDDPLRYEVFTDRYGRVTTEFDYQANGPVAKVIKACSDAEDTLLLFVDKQAEQAEG